jgi:hypothetical protein
MFANAGAPIVNPPGLAASYLATEHLEQRKPELWRAESVRVVLLTVRENSPSI